MYEPSRIGDDIADVLLDTENHLVWVVCGRCPDHEPSVRDADADTSLRCIHTSASPEPMCPSVVFAYTYDRKPELLVVDGHMVNIAVQTARLKAHFRTLPPNAVIITTLFKYDAHALETFVHYYSTTHKVTAFLLYDNNAVPAAPDKSIHWPLAYWAAPGIHHAQSAQLTHAALLCALHAPGAWLFNFDLDEYLVSPRPLPDIASIAAAGGCDAIGVRSQWADGTVSDIGTDALRTAPFVFQWPQRGKYGQRHVFDDGIHRGIHSPAYAQRLVILDPEEEGTLVHLAFASGAPREPGVCLLFK